MLLLRQFYCASMTDPTTTPPDILPVPPNLNRGGTSCRLLQPEAYRSGSALGESSLATTSTV
jgi:hypothetical protein